MERAPRASSTVCISAALSLMSHEDVDEGIRRFAVVTATSPLSPDRRTARPLISLYTDPHGHIDPRTVVRASLQGGHRGRRTSIPLRDSRYWSGWRNAVSRRLLGQRRSGSLPRPSRVCSVTTYTPHDHLKPWRRCVWRRRVAGERGDVEEALEHFAKAQRPDLSPDMIKEHRREAIDTERWRALTRWVARVDQRWSTLVPTWYSCMPGFRTRRPTGGASPGSATGCPTARPSSRAHAADEVLEERSRPCAGGKLLAGRRGATLTYAREHSLGCPRTPFPSGVTTAFVGTLCRCRETATRPSRSFGPPGWAVGRRTDRRLMIGMASTACMPAARLRQADGGEGAVRGGRPRNGG